MTENTQPNTPDSNSTSDSEAQTAPIEIPVQDPPKAAAEPEKSRSGVPAWAVISGAAAAGLVVVAGIGGFALGQASDQSRGHDSVQLTADGAPQGQNDQRGEGDDQNHQGRGDGQGPDGQQMMPGDGMQGRGVDPDGDNWTGQNRGERMMPGQDGQQGQQMMPGDGMQGRGVDPDGDNWTGQNRGGGQQMMPGDGMGGQQGFGGPGDWDPNSMLTQEDLQQLLEQFMQQGQQGFGGGFGDDFSGGMNGHHGFSQGS